MSTTLVAPAATFASMMEFVAARHVYKEDRYPNGDFSTAERRARFVLDHTLLHVGKSLGQIDAGREGHDHGELLDVDNMRIPVTKLFVNLLTFAGELGMTADLLQSMLDQSYVGYFGPSILMRNEHSRPERRADSVLEMQASAIMYRLLNLDMLKGELARGRLVEFCEVSTGLYDPRKSSYPGDRRGTVVAMIAHTCSLAFALNMSIEDIATLIPQVMRHG